MLRYIVVGIMLCNISSGWAEEPITLETVVDPGPNQLDEPLAQEFSLTRAARFLDSASLQWQKQRKCFTCHTNLAYLYARPHIKLPNTSQDSLAHQIVRQYAEELVTERWPSKGPRWDAEVVATAAALAFNDAHTTKKLHPITRKALDRMWELQRSDGGWNWLKCGWPPFEYDDHYGATLAAIATGIAPEDYANTETAKLGLQRVRDYLKEHPPGNLHHRAMLLWVSAHVDSLLSEQEKQQCVDDIFAQQKSDGGWAIASLGNWKRADGSEQDTETSDGYGTGFSIFVLRQAGVAADNARVKRGIAWLKKNQRASGRWFSRSLYRDNKHFLSHAGSAFAVMAIATCSDEDPISQVLEGSQR